METPISDTTGKTTTLAEGLVRGRITSTRTNHKMMHLQNNTIPWYLQGMIQEIRSLMESIPQTKITHDYREANLAADKLANDGRSSTTTPGDIINKNNLKVMNQDRRMTSHGPGTIHMHR